MKCITNSLTNLIAGLSRPMSTGIAINNYINIVNPQQPTSFQLVAADNVLAFVVTC